tara:strand:+ start:764 stop:1018 length:255 start_codon:yes stop_codon:yes gene_type:complete
MKFFLVVIICFGADCQAIFEENSYERYDICMETASSTAQFMKYTYPESHGQVDCLNENEFEKLQEKIKNGEPLTLPNQQKPESV